MAKIKKNIGDFVSGKIGNVVFVTNGKSSYVRSAPNRKDNNWTDLQKYYRLRIGKIAALWRELKSLEFNVIWNASNPGTNSYASFVKKNIPSFSIDGSVFFPQLLFVSAGSLVPLQNLKISIASNTDKIISAEWENDEHTTAKRLNDKIYAMAYYNGIFSPITFTGLHRSDLNGQFSLPLSLLPHSKEITDAVLYIFTGSIPDNKFSNSCNFELDFN